jgi:hypothetical protein
MGWLDGRQARDVAQGDKLRDEGRRLGTQGLPA